MLIKVCFGATQARLVSAAPLVATDDEALPRVKPLSSNSPPHLAMSGCLAWM